MRYEKEVVWKLYGDVKLAQKYLGIARGAIGALVSTNQQNVPQLTSRTDLAPGVYCVATIMPGSVICEIHAEPGGDAYPPEGSCAGFLVRGGGATDTAVKAICWDEKEEQWVLTTKKKFSASIGLESGHFYVCHAKIGEDEHPVDISFPTGHIGTRTNCTAIYVDGWAYGEAPAAIYGLTVLRQNSKDYLCVITWDQQLFYKEFKIKGTSQSPWIQGAVSVGGVAGLRGTYAATPLRFSQTDPGTGVAVERKFRYYYNYEAYVVNIKVAATISVGSATLTYSYVNNIDVETGARPMVVAQPAAVMTIPVPLDKCAWFTNAAILDYAAGVSTNSSALVEAVGEGHNSNPLLRNLPISKIWTLGFTI